MADEKRYLDYDGLAYLVEKLTNKIEASGSGGGADAHAVDLLRSVVSFPSSPSYGSSGSSLGSYSPGADDIPLGDVVELADDLSYAAMECEDPRFVMEESGSAKTGYTYYISCQGGNGTGSDIHTTLRLTLYFTDGEERTVNVVAVQSAAATASGSAGHTGACDGVFVAYVDYDGVKRIVAYGDWDGSLGAAQGVMVGDGTHEVMAGLYQARDDWMLYTETETSAAGIITTTDSSLALADFSGRLNMDGLVAAGGTCTDAGYAVGDALAYARGAVGAGSWRLPTLGELRLIWQHLSDVMSATLTLGGATYDDDGDYPYWSSTQYNASNMWVHYFNSSGGVSGTGRKGTQYGSSIYLRPVAEWDYVL